LLAPARNAQRLGNKDGGDSKVPFEAVPLSGGWPLKNVLPKPPDSGPALRLAPVQKVGVDALGEREYFVRAG